MQEFIWPIRVYYEDTDAGGVVYYANYLKFMERARTEWLRSMGFEQDAMRRDSAVIFAVRSAQVEYLQPARFNDALTVSVAMSELGRASIVLSQSICREGEAAALCTGVIRIASLDAETFRPVAIPKAMMEKLQQGE